MARDINMKALVTTQLERSQILSLIESILPVLIRFWEFHIKGFHGGVTNVPDEQQYVFHNIDTVDLLNHLVQEESNRQSDDFSVSEMDYWIKDLSETGSIQLCHESDVHFDLTDQLFREAIMHKLNELGIAFTLHDKES